MALSKETRGASDLTVVLRAPMRFQVRGRALGSSGSGSSHEGLATLVRDFSSRTVSQATFLSGPFAAISGNAVLGSVFMRVISTVSDFFTTAKAELVHVFVSEKQRRPLLRDKELGNSGNAYCQDLYHTAAKGG